MKTSLDVINAGVGTLRSLYEGYPASSVAVIRSMTKEEQDTLYEYLKQLSDFCRQEINRRKSEEE